MDIPVVVPRDAEPDTEPFEALPAAPPAVDPNDRVTVPLRCACTDTWFSFPKASRGTPSPAESFRNTITLLSRVDFVSGFSFTSTSDVSPTGGRCGGPTLTGPFVGRSGITAFSNPTKFPPGCHPQPAPPQFTQLPEW